VHGIGKYFVLLMAVTFSMLIFVWQQISIVQSSYSINNSKLIYEKLVEENRNLKLKLVSQTTPNALEEKLVQAEVKLTYPEEISFIKVQPLKVAPFQVASLNNKKNAFNMLKILGFEQEAQAEVSY